jgi:hypothetical protein
LFIFPYLDRREILRFAQNDSFSAGLKPVLPGLRRQARTTVNEQRNTNKDRNHAGGLRVTHTKE